MSIVSFSLAEARAAAHSDQMARIRGVRGNIGYQYSYWEGHALVSYLFRKGHKFFYSTPAPADLEKGNLIDPKGGFFSGKKVTLDPADLEGLAGIAVTIYGGERHAEFGYRVIFQMWAEDYEVPVYVRLASDKYPWHSIIWEHTETDCREISPEGIEHCGAENDPGI